MSRQPGSSNDLAKMARYWRISRLRGPFAKPCRHITSSPVQRTIYRVLKSSIRMRLLNKVRVYRDQASLMADDRVRCSRIPRSSFRQHYSYPVLTEKRPVCRSLTLTRFSFCSPANILSDHDFVITSPGSDLGTLLRSRKC